MSTREQKMPEPEEPRSVGPLGSSVSEPVDPESQGAADDGPASGAAGPSWPPAETEPAAHRD
ncbi:hypothetical protein [Geodermatophilus maliterrae]|uniref:Uncharacterized protein n=1 Tax=Geodermatophilus maliterrae TaxID=3162531 RepID=A0ABV3XIP5_9ACTN